MMTAKEAREYVEANKPPKGLPDYVDELNKIIEQSTKYFLFSTTWTCPSVYYPFISRMLMDLGYKLTNASLIVDPDIMESFLIYIEW